MKALKTYTQTLFPNCYLKWVKAAVLDKKIPIIPWDIVDACNGMLFNQYLGKK